MDKWAWGLGFRVEAHTSWLCKVLQAAPDSTPGLGYRGFRV